MKRVATMLTVALALPAISATAQQAPSYCSPCLFYGGDFSATHYPQATSSESDLTVSDSNTYVPFSVPSGQSWDVTSVFFNMMLNDRGVLDPEMANWSISTGMRSSDAGTVVASGSGAAQVTPTGRSWPAAKLVEYTIAVGVPDVVLGSGEYWLSVQPLCTNVSDPVCATARFWVSNAPAEYHGYGPAEPTKRSLFNEPASGYDFEPVCGYTPAPECNAWSAGVVGNIE
jgi:hypothetical protein